MHTFKIVPLRQQIRIAFHRLGRICEGVIISPPKQLSCVDTALFDSHQTETLRIKNVCINRVTDSTVISRDTYKITPKSGEREYL